MCIRDRTETSEEEDLFDREEVMKFINDAGLLSYNVRALRICLLYTSMQPLTVRGAVRSWREPTGKTHMMWWISKAV